MSRTARRDKLLAEWFWTDRWMGSSAFLLPMEPRGLYREMLTQAWRREARLPNDHEAIRRAVGCTEKEWARSWPKISRYWRVDGDFLINDTQIEIYQEAKAAQDRASERGRKGAQATAQALAQACAQAPTQAGAQSSARAFNERVLKHQPPSPSPYPSLQRTENGRTDPSVTDLSQPEVDRLGSEMYEERGTRRRPQMSVATAAEICQLAQKLAELYPAKDGQVWISECSLIDNGDPRGPKSFTDPRRPGIGEEWGRATVARLADLLRRDEERRSRLAVG